MQEKILQNKKHGMVALVLISILYIVGIGALIYGGILMDAQEGAFAIAIFVVGCVWVSIGWIPFLGLKILKPQEALVLTLFGKYVGTIKGDGFYFVNPFCQSVNPASKTKLNQRYYTFT